MKSCRALLPRRRVLSLMIGLATAAFATATCAEQDALTMTGKHVYIVHGYMASPQDHWFGWLRTQLQARGAEVSVLAMPDSARPSAAAWQAHLQKQVVHHDRDSYFVGHSLGCIALLRYLDSLDQPTPIGGLVLVAGFAEALSRLPELDGFTRAPLDYPHLIGLAPRRAVLASRDDAVVPYRQTEALARALQAPLLSVAHGGHFLGSEGHTTLPPVYEELEKMMRP